MNSKPQATPEYYDALAERLFTGVVSDMLDEVGRFAQVLQPGLAPVGAVATTLVGRARTVRLAPTVGLPKQPYTRLLDAIDDLRSGDVLLMSGGRQTSGLFGGLLSAAVSARGARGAIVDGTVRDSREIIRQRLQVFAAGVNPADSRGRDEVVGVDEPVDCRGTRITPGDLVIGDADGVVIVPHEIEAEVVRRALDKVTGEGRMREDLAAGMKASEAFARHGIL